MKHLTITSFLVLLSTFVIGQQKAADLAISELGYNEVSLNYHGIPVQQAAELSPKTLVYSIANFEYTNVYAEYWLTNSASDTLYHELSNVVSIDSAGTDSLYSSVPFGTLASGSYNLHVQVYSDSVDGIPANNMADLTLKVTDYVYFRDNKQSSGPCMYPGAMQFVYEVGNLFETPADQTLYGIDVKIHSNSVPGSIVYATIYDSFNMILTQTDERIIQSSDLGQVITLPFSFPQDLIGGEWYSAMAGSYEGMNVLYEQAQLAEPVTSFLIDDTWTWYYINATPMVRLNFDPSTSDSEVNEELEISIYPNPAIDATQIILQGNHSGSLRLYNSAGQLAMQESLNFNNSTTIDVSELAKGIYQGVYTEGEFQHQFKLVKE